MTMTKEQEFDELMVAKIIAAAESSGETVRRGHWGSHFEGDRVVSDGPCCAVGVGCLYRPLRTEEFDAASDRCQGPELFAIVHGTASSYAWGASDAFEEYDERRIKNRISNRFWSKSELAEYHRGHSVGEAVRAAFEDVP